MNMRENLTDNEIASARESFDFFDQDGNNEIDLDEFEGLLKVLSPKATREQAEAGFAHIDKNKDNKIDFDEFIAWWKLRWWEF